MDETTRLSAQIGICVADSMADGKWDKTEVKCLKDNHCIGS